MDSRSAQGVRKLLCRGMIVRSAKCKEGQPLIVHIGKVNQILLSWWVSKVRLPLSCAAYTKSQHNSRQQRSPKIYYKTCKHYSVCLVVDL